MKYTCYYKSRVINGLSNITRLISKIKILLGTINDVILSPGWTKLYKILSGTQEIQTFFTGG